MNLQSNIVSGTATSAEAEKQLIHGLVYRVESLAAEQMAPETASR